MALGDIYNIDPRPLSEINGGGTRLGRTQGFDAAPKGDAAISSRLGELRASSKERDGMLDVAVDRTQELLYGGAEVVGGMLEKRGVDFGTDIKKFGIEGIEQQKRDLEAGGWEASYPGSFTDQKGFGDSFGWLVEGMITNSGQTAVGVAGGLAALATAAVSAPAAAAIAGVTAMSSGAMMAGETLGEQKEKGVLDYDVAGGTGLVAGLLETVGIGKLLPKSWIAKATTGQVVDQVAKLAGKEQAKYVAKELLKKGFSEAATESLQEGLIMGSTKSLGGEYTYDEVVDRLIDSAILGGAMGTAVGGSLDAASGKFGGAATKSTPEQGEDPTTKLIQESEKPGKGPRQLSLFGDDDLPGNATRNEQGEIEVVNPVTSAPVVNKKLTNMLKFIATLEARKAAEPNRASSLNGGIQQVVNRMDKMFGQTPDADTGTADDVTNWLEAKDIVKHYRTVLNKEKKATTAKAKREAEKAKPRPPFETAPTQVEDEVVSQAQDDAPVDVPAPKVDRTAAIAAAANKVQAQEPITEADLDELDTPTVERTAPTQTPDVPVAQPTPEVEAPVSPEVQPVAGQAPAPRIDFHYQPKQPMTGTLHTLRNAEDLESVLDSGLQTGTNVGNQNSQAAGGGITLEYDPDTVNVEVKSYQDGEGLITDQSDVKPIRILVDTSDLGLSPEKSNYETVETEMSDFHEKFIKEEGGITDAEWFGDIGTYIEEFANPSRGVMAQHGKAEKKKFEEKYGSRITKEFRKVAKRWAEGLENLGEEVAGQTDDQYVQTIANRADGIPVFTYQVDDNGKPTNVEQFTDDAPAKEEPIKDLKTFAKERFGLDVAKFEEWTAKERNDVTTAWTAYKIEQGREALAPTDESGQRTMDSVQLVPQKANKAKAPSKARPKKQARQSDTIPEGAIYSGKKGGQTPYETLRTAATQLGRKGLKETHEVVQIGEGMFVLAPKAIDATTSEVSPAPAKTASPDLQAMFEEGETGVAAPVDLAIADVEDGVSVEQAAELQSRWTSFMDSEKGRSDFGKQWNKLAIDFMDAQGTESFADTDWTSDAGRNLYKTLTNAVAGRKLTASILQKNEKNEALKATARQTGMGDITDRLADEDQAPGKLTITDQLTVEERATAEAVEIQVLEPEVAPAPPVETKAKAKQTPAKPAHPENKAPEPEAAVSPVEATKGRPKGKTMPKSALMRLSKDKLIKHYNEVVGKPISSAGQATVIKKTKSDLADGIIAAGSVAAPEAKAKSGRPSTKAKPIKEADTTGILDEDSAPIDTVDRDVFFAEKEAEKLAVAEPQTKKEVVIDTRVQDIKKNTAWINSEITRYKDLDYTDEDSEIISLKEQRRENTAQLRELGALKTPKKTVKLSDQPGEIPMASMGSDVSTPIEDMLRAYGYPTYLTQKLGALRDAGQDISTPTMAQAEADMLNHDPVFLKGREGITWINNMNIPGFEGWKATGYVDGPNSETVDTVMIEVEWTDPNGDPASPVTTWIEADASLNMDPQAIRNAAMRQKVQENNLPIVEEPSISITSYEDGKDIKGNYQKMQTASHYMAIKKVYDDFTSRVNIPELDIILIRSMNDLPTHRRDRLLTLYPNGFGPRGLYYVKSQWNPRATVYLIANATENPSKAGEVLLHEVVGHHGFHAMFGKDWEAFMLKSLAATPDLFQRAYKTTDVAGKNAWGFDINPQISEDGVLLPTIEVELNGGIRLVDKATAIHMLDELLAITAQKFHTQEFIDMQKTQKAWFLRLKAWIKHKLRSFGIGNNKQYKLTEEDIVSLLGEYYGKVAGYDQKGELRSGANATKKYTKEDLARITASQEYSTYIDPSEEAEYIADINLSDSIYQSQAMSVPSMDIAASIELQGQEWAQLNKSYFGQKYETFVQTFQKKHSKITQFLNPNENLNNANAKRVIMNRTLGKITQVTDSAQRAAKVFRGMDDTQKKQVYGYFKDAQGDATLLHSLDRPQQLAVQEYKGMITEFGQDLVDLGLLDQKVYDRQKGTYLHQGYLKYLSAYKGSSKRTSPLDYLKKKDTALSQEEKTRLGNLEQNIDFIVPDMLATIGRDVALLEYTKQIVNVSNSQGLKWVLPNSKVQLPDGREYGMFDLSRDIERWDDILVNGVDESNTAADIEKLREDTAIAKQLLAQKEEELKVQVENDKTLNETYKKVPNRQEYGSLAGEYVATVIFDEMTDNVTGATPNSGGMLSQFFDPNMFANKAHQWWKIAKVPMNPPSWIRNGIGNLTLLDLSTSTNIGSLTVQVLREISDALTGNTSFYREKAIEKGLFGTTFSTQEIYVLKTKFERDKARKLSEMGEDSGNLINAVDTLQEGLMIASEFSNGLYGQLEGVFKTVKMKDYVKHWEKENGVTLKSLSEEKQDQLLDEAALSANEAIFDYSDVPQWLRMGRRSILGAPFLTYTYKAAPAVMRGFANNPQKFLKYMMLPYALTALATSVGDLDDDDMEEFKKKGSKWMAEKTGVYVLPWKDSNNNMQAMDFGYYFPWAPWMDLYKGTNANWKSEDPVVSTITSVGAAASNLGFLGGPLPAMINGALSGQDDFTGRDIIQPGSMESEKIANTLSWLWTMWTPSMLGSTGVFSKISDRLDLHPISAVTGLPKNSNSLNKYGRPRSSAGQDIARAPGLNVYSVDTEASHRGNLKGFDFEKREVKMARTKMMQNRNVPTQEKVKRLKEYNKSIHRINERRQKYLREGF